jgi:acyl-CoA synthetase (AMP-forming)/AMP-acid ligase II
MEAFCPAYGLAEATLLVSTSAGTAPLVRSFDRDTLATGRYKVCNADEPDARPLVGNGVPAPGMEIRIVDPVSFQLCADGQIGEVWVSGPSVAQGYWNKPDLNASVFAAGIEGVGGQFLRTGDTGFLLDGQLFIAGRIKDLIILSGRNHAPEDIEQAVRESDPVFNDFAGAVFSMDADGDEVLVVVHEIARHALKAERDVEDLFRTVHRALFSENVRADAIVFLRPGSLPRTSSGKVQRHRCRDGFLHNTLNVAAEWLSPRVQRARPVPTRVQSIL